MSMTRRDFLKTAAVSSALLVRNAWSAEATKDKLTDEEILSECQARIGPHRKSDGLIRLRDAAGNPVSRATIRVEQLRHDFLFGCNCYMLNRTGDPEREEKYRQQFAALFNLATLGFYWANYEFQRGKPNYNYTDQAAAWCEQQDITCKGHPLVWDHPAGSPRWLPEDPQEIKPSQRRASERS